MKQVSFKDLPKRKKVLLDLWMKNQLGDEGLRDDLMSNEDLLAQSDELLTALLKILSIGGLEDADTKTVDAINDILSSISISRARQGFSPRETGMFIFSLKQALFQLLQEEFAGQPEMLYEAVIRVSHLIDHFSIITFETYIKGREEVILRQTDEINEISTPVIRVWEGIVAMPIIGTLDSARTQVVMESLLQEIVNTSSSVAILDISGVPAVDSLVAQHLIKTVSATRLMGAECIISGIRPEIAQTVVHLGIDLSNVITKSSLASALRHAYSMLQLEVRKKQNSQSAITVR